MFSKRLLALFITAALLQAGAAAQAASGRISIRSGHVKRTALVVEFERLKRMRRPTVIVLHGSNGNVGRVRRALGLDEEARTSGMAIVYPDLIGENRRGLRSATNRLDDVAFIKQVIAKLVNDGIADHRRIFLAGVRSGGALALRLACSDANLVAGVAVVGAELPPSVAASCKPSRPVPLLMITDAPDSQTPSQAGLSDSAEQKAQANSTPASLAPFAAAAGCAASTPAPVLLSPRKDKDGSRATVETFNGCKAPVELIRLQDAERAPPGGHADGRRAGAHVPWSRDIDLKLTVGRFFQRLAR